MRARSAVLAIFVAAGSGARAEPGPRTTLRAAGATLEFFPELAAALEDFAAKRPADAFPAPRLDCPQHERLSAGPARCGAVEATNSICREIRDPVGYFGALPPRTFEWSGVGDIEGMIRLVAPRIAAMDGAEPMFRREHAERLKPVLVKIRLPALRETIAARRAAVAELGKNPEAHASCLASAKVDLEGLSRELDSLETELERVERDGLRRAREDGERVARGGRRRDDLPFPSLTDEERRFLSFGLGAFMWSARGGGLFGKPGGTNRRRIAYTLIPMRAIARLNGGDRVSGLGTGLWLGLFRKWGIYQDMGRWPGGDDKWTDFAGMKRRGAFQVKFVLPQLRWRGYETRPVEDAGDMMAYCYWYGWERLEKTQMGMRIGAGTDYRPAAVWATGWGELCVGAAMGLGFSESLLGGYAK